MEWKSAKVMLITKVNVFVDEAAHTAGFYL